MELLIPFNEEAEQSILGSIFLDEECLDEVIGVLHPDHFYQERNRIIYHTIASLYQLGKNYDLISVIERLKVKKNLERVGGKEYVLMLQSSTPTSAFIQSHAEIVIDQYIRRQAIKAAESIKKIAVMGDFANVQDMIDQIEHEAMSLRPEQKSGLQRITTGLYQVIDEVAASKETEFIPTGFKEVDEFLGGLQRQWLFVLSARPSEGKTALSLAIATNVSKANVGPVAVFSQEMATKQVQRRLLSSQSGVWAKKLIKRNVADWELEKLIDAGADFEEMNLYIDDSPNVSVEYVQAQLKRLKREHGKIGLVVIDYLGLMKHQEKKSGTKAEAVGDTSKRLKNIARTLDCTVLLLVQMNRSVESRSDKKPQMSDLRESGQIEADADIIAFLSHDQNKSFVEVDKPVRFIEMDIVKGRDVGVAKFDFHFRPYIQTFKEVGVSH